MIQPSRRGFITGLVSLAVTAPAIVRAASIMPVKLMRPSPQLIYSNRVIRSYIDVRYVVDRNVLLRLGTHEPTFRGIPIHVLDPIP
jgi:hypothetical protein